MTCPAVILFDLDDTLYPEREFLHSGWRAVAVEAERYGIDTEEAYAVMSAADNAFDALHARVPHMSVARMLEVYRFHKPSLKLGENVVKLLSVLRKAGCVTGVITDGRSATQRNKIEALGLAPMLDYIGISEETGADKHSRLTFEKAVEACGKVAKYIYVGDNPAKDFLWPNEMGWTTVMLREKSPGLNIHKQDVAGCADVYRPSFIVEDITDVIRFV